MPGNKNSGRRTRYEETCITKKQAEWRAKIQVGAILNALKEHIEGRRKMGSTQIRAAEILLSKALPTLSSTEITGDIEHTHHGLTDSQLDEQIRRQARIAGLAAGETPQNRGNGADSVH